MSETHAETDVSQAKLRAERATEGKHNYYLSALEFGRNARRDNANASWADHEARMRDDWQAQHEDSVWEDVKESVREGWESITND